MKQNEFLQATESPSIPNTTNPSDLLKLRPDGKLPVLSSRTLAQMLQLAKDNQTDGEELSSLEAERFSRNLSVLTVAKRAQDLRNYLLLEIYETKQWRGQYQTFEECGITITDLSYSQVMKCVKKARVLLDMYEAGMDQIAPKGKQLEALAKLPRIHWIRAWRYVLKAYETGKKSQLATESALNTYCEENHFRCGSWGMKDDAEKPARKNSKSKAIANTRDCRTRSPDADWTLSLSKDEEALLRELHCAGEHLETARSNALPDVSVEQSVRILRTMAATSESESTPVLITKLLDMLEEKDPELANRLHEMALICLHEAYKEEIVRVLKAQICD